MVQFHSHNSFKCPRICCRKKASLFLMMHILRVQLNFWSNSSVKYLLLLVLPSLSLWFLPGFPVGLRRHLKTTYDNIYIDVTRIKWLSTTKNIKPTQGFIKPTALVTSIIFNISTKHSLAQSISCRPITPSFNVLLPFMHLRLQIKIILFFKICESYARCTGSTCAYFFILFLNICKDIAFKAQKNNCWPCDIIFYRVFI